MKTFEVLNKIDVSGLTKKKGAFDYLPWASAVREASKVYPGINWTFTTWDNLPYLKTETGFYVECTVTINDVNRTQMMPVLNHKNQPDMKPNAMAINKSQMRALTKAIALHGLGLDLWAGEDLNDGYEEDGSVKIENTINDEQVNQLAELLLDADGNLNKKGQKVVAAYKLTSFEDVKEKDFNKILEVASK